MCQPRSLGGLGVRDVRVVNVSRLAKWRWRLIQPEHSLWKEVLFCKYGSRIGFLLNAYANLWPAFASRWWLDVVTLEGVAGANWFNTEVVRKVGNGMNTRFWLDHWMGNAALCVSYPRLFSISNQKDALVGDLSEATVGGGTWNLIWRRKLFVWEESLVENLMGDLEGWVCSDMVDSWNWNPLASFTSGIGTPLPLLDFFVFCLQM